MCPRHGRTGHIECHHIPLALDYMETDHVWSQNTLAMHVNRFREYFGTESQNIVKTAEKDGYGPLVGKAETL